MLRLCVVELFASNSKSKTFVCRDTSAAFIPYLKTHHQASRSSCVEMQIQAALGRLAKLSEAAQMEAAQSDTIHMEKMLQV